MESPITEMVGVVELIVYSRKRPDQPLPRASVQTILQLCWDELPRGVYVYFFYDYKSSTWRLKIQQYTGNGLKSGSQISQGDTFHR